MRKKPSYEMLQQKVNALEKQVIEFKESEAALRDSEQYYRDLYENAPISYFSINRNDGSILRFNSEAVQLLGHQLTTSKNNIRLNLINNIPIRDWTQHKVRMMIKRIRESRPQS